MCLLAPLDGGTAMVACQCWLEVDEWPADPVLPSPAGPLSKTTLNDKEVVLLSLGLEYVMLALKEPRLVTNMS